MIPNGPPLSPGVLLVAHPSMDDDRFDRSVVAIVAHDDAGTAGVIVNKPADVPGGVNGIIGEWLDSSPPPHVVFRGGPVQPDGFICLAEQDFAPGGFESIDFIAQDPEPGRRHRIFRGHAGWAAGQLSDEIANGMWVVTASTTDDLFCIDPHRLWNDVLRRQGPPLARLAALPHWLHMN